MKMRDSMDVEVFLLLKSYHRRCEGGDIRDERK